MYQLIMSVANIFLVFVVWSMIVLTVGYLMKMVITLPEDTLLLRGSEL